MNREKKSSALRLRLLCFSLIICTVALLLSGCGGGFGADCPKASGLSDSIFGPDSASRH